MNAANRILIYLTAVFLAPGISFAEDSPIRQDARALDVLNNMGAYTASLDRALITGVRHHDARLAEGLMVSNSMEVTVRIDRPGSLRISSFDGKEHSELYFHDETLTVFSPERGYYAQAGIPDEIDEALEFVLEELDVEAPMMDMIKRDASVHLLDAKATVLYLTDNALVDGVDCHHIAIRGPETDVQMWVEEGDQPLPRRIMMTSKWEGGSPRVTANLRWKIDPEFGPDTFVFKAPDGSVNIGFAQSSTSGGE